MSVDICSTCNCNVQVALHGSLVPVKECLIVPVGGVMEDTEIPHSCSSVTQVLQMHIIY